MTEYAQMDPLALNRLAAERAGHILAPEDENLGGDYFIVVSKELAAYSKSAPDDEYDLTYYGYGPDYTGSVDAALQLPGLAGRPYAIMYWPDVDQHQASIRGDDGAPHLEWANEPGFAMTACWCKWQAARAGKGEG